MCNFTEAHQILDILKAPIGDRLFNSHNEAITQNLIELNLMVCRSCNLLQLQRIWSLESIYSDYFYTTSNTKKLIEIYRDLSTRLIQRLAIDTNDKILDIGSGDGSLLNFFYQNGIQGIGIDPNSDRLLCSKYEESGNINNYFEKISLKQIQELSNKKFKVIFCNFTIANIDNLQKFLINLYSIGTSDTTYVVITGYHPKQFTSLMFDYISHDHLNYFTIETFNSLISTYGFSLISYNFIDFRGGCMMFTFKKQKFEKKSFIKESKFDEKDITEKFLQFKNEIKILQEYLQSLSKGQKISGIGAGTSTSYFLSHMDRRFIEKFDFIFDDDHKKIGKYLPFFGLQIQNLEKLQGHKSMVLLISWQHTDLLIQRLKSLNFIGDVIVPLPKFKVINLSKL
jgi:ubiquinone/menaquinone biosynthesis C-methylase UbiE